MTRLDWVECVGLSIPAVLFVSNWEQTHTCLTDCISIWNWNSQMDGWIAGLKWEVFLSWIKIEMAWLKLKCEWNAWKRDIIQYTVEILAENLFYFFSYVSDKCSHINKENKETQLPSWRKQWCYKLLVPRVMFHCGWSKVWVAVTADVGSILLRDIFSKWGSRVSHNKTWPPPGSAHIKQQFLQRVWWRPSCETLVAFLLFALPSRGIEFPPSSVWTYIASRNPLATVSDWLLAELGDTQAVALCLPQSNSVLSQETKPQYTWYWKCIMSWNSCSISFYLDTLKLMFGH